ncbi:MAG: hypothetical protein R3C59_22575 [Planctomycetaceae bacterium]
MSRADNIREIQERYCKVADSLNERERRQWAASQASRIGYGGMTLVSEALRMSPNTIRKGQKEIAAGPSEAPCADTRIRRPGGGRKRRES